MSSGEGSAVRRAGGVLRPAMRPWRLAALAAVVAIGVGLALGMHLHSSGGGRGPALAAGAGPNTGPVHGGQGGSNGGSPNAGSGNGTGSSPSPSSSASGQKGKAGAQATPTHFPMPTGTPADYVAGNADVLHSNCGLGYEPGAQCTVYYNGYYALVTRPTGRLMFNVTIDGTVANSVDWVAPGGGHRFGDNLKFTVPAHAHKIIYQSFLEDATGKVIASSSQQVTYGYG